MPLRVHRQQVVAVGDLNPAAGAERSAVTADGRHGRLRVAVVDGGADGGSLALGPAVHLFDDPMHLGARPTVEQYRGGTGGAGGTAPPPLFF